MKRAAFYLLLPGCLRGAWMGFCCRCFRKNKAGSAWRLAQARVCATSALKKAKQGLSFERGFLCPAGTGAFSLL